jgi:excinuclease ABC subunit A
VLFPEGGDRGGYVIACGTPEKLAQKEESYTGQYLRHVLIQFSLDICINVFIMYI